MYLKMPHRQKFKSTFHKYLLSFLFIVLSITFLTLFLTYRLMRNTLTEDIVIQQALLLENSNKSIHKKSLEIIDTAYSILFNPAFINYATNPKNTFLYNELNDFIITIEANQPDIIAIDLYFNQSDQLLSSKGATRLLNTSLHQQLIEESIQNNSYHYWSKTNHFINNDQKLIPIISYVQTIKNSNQESLGYVMIHIEASSLDKLIVSSNNHTSYLLSDDGSILTTSDTLSKKGTYPYSNFHLIQNTPYSDGFIKTNSQYDQTIIHFKKIASVPWIVINETPFSYIESKIFVLLKGILLIGFAAIIVSIFLSYFMTLRLYAPIKRLLNKTHNTEFSHVFNYIDSLQSKEKQLKHELFMHTPIIVERLIRELITKRRVNAPHIKDQLNYLGIALPYSTYTIIIIEISNFEMIEQNWSITEQNTLFFALKNISNEIIANHAYGFSSEFSESQIVLLINTQQKNIKSVLSKIAIEIQNTLSILLNVEVTISIGNSYENIEKCHVSFLEAKDIQQYSMIFENTIIHFSEYNNQQSSNYYNPIKELNDIEKALRLGQLETVQNNLLTIFNTLKTKKSLSYENTYKILNRLIDIILWVIDDLNYSLSDLFDSNYKIYEELNNKKTLAEIELWLNSLFEKLIHHINHEKINDISYINQIIEFIQANYKDDIYLDLIAEHVGLNSSYTSRLFKKATSETITDYINRIRISESKKLLSNTNLPINEIAKQVGFNNVYSYNRRFKKDVSVTPSQYRKDSNV